MRALSRIPRDKAIEGIHAFNAMRYIFSCFLPLKFTLVLTNLFKGMTW